MAKFYDKAEMFAWMPLIGFDKDLADKGVDKLTDRIGFKLNGTCLMVCHPDLVHYHEGMDEQIVLPPDMCSYYANPYNEERSRQEWTNYDLRDLVLKLKEDGTEAFMSIFGIALDNLYAVSLHSHSKAFFQNGHWTLKHRSPHRHHEAALPQPCHRLRFPGLWPGMPYREDE